MTILCVAATGVEGVSRCTEPGEHGILCPDDPRRGGGVQGVCRGCLPQRAERGFLCQRHYDRVVHAYEEWGPWLRKVNTAEGRTVSPETGGATPDGFTNLTLAFLMIDECERFLASMGGTLDVWVHTEAGAADALRFAVAAERAYRSLEVEVRPHRIERIRCPNCGLLSLHENPVEEAGGKAIITCQYCAHVLDEIKLPSNPRWFGSVTCEADDHTDCDSFQCRCVCHDLGSTRRSSGVGALWDADLWAERPDLAPRGEWVIEDGKLRHTPDQERRTA